MRFGSGVRSRPWRVLLVDDDAESREMYAECLTEFEVCQADNGAVAIGAAIQSKPDVIIMDLQMPVMDGLEAIARLKADERTQGIPIAVLSGDSVAEHAKAKRAGCAVCLVKPCCPEELANVIRALADPCSLELPPRGSVRG